VAQKHEWRAGLRIRSPRDTIPCYGELLMSNDSLPAPDDQHNPDIVFTNVISFEAKRMQRVRVVDAPAPKPRRRRREDRKSGLWVIVHAARQHGFTHPTLGGFLQLPREFDAILALEPKPVTQVVLEVLRQTIGTPVYDQFGNTQRKEWARISQRDFSRAGIMSKKDAAYGIEGALKQGYIVRRKVGAQRFEYAIRWKGSN
jgi:hypothetical protein